MLSKNGQSYAPSSDTMPLAVGLCAASSEEVGNQISQDREVKIFLIYLPVGSQVADGSPQMKWALLPQVIMLNSYFQMWSCNIWLLPWHFIIISIILNWRRVISINGRDCFQWGRPYILFWLTITSPDLQQCTLIIWIDLVSYQVASWFAIGREMPLFSLGSAFPVINTDSLWVFTNKACYGWYFQIYLKWGRLDE